MNNLEIITKNVDETREVAKILGQELLKTKQRSEGAFIIGLIGDLGSGKTTFIQFLAKELGIKQTIISPTFVILKKYSLKAKSAFLNFYHLDCYRLNSSRDLMDLGFDEIVKQPENLILIEWVEKIKDILPKDALILKFEFMDEKSRNIGVGQ